MDSPCGIDPMTNHTMSGPSLYEDYEVIQPQIASGNFNKISVDKLCTLFSFQTTALGFQDQTTGR